jgi:DNA-binding transcriptional MerR regulator
MDETELYSIGDAARRTGLSISAIRFYADAGIIEPSGHSEAGYRLYDVQAIARLELVRTLRELDVGLDGIRCLLADETTLHDLVTAHLELVDLQMRRLEVRRAVLRALAKQRGTAERVSLMHRLVSMSDGERDRLIDEFWSGISAHPDLHPAVERLRTWRPDLPEDPTAEQLDAWIDLASRVQDDSFRRSISNVLSRAQERVLTTPQGDRRLAALLEAREVCQGGLPADSPQAREIVNQLVAATAEVTGEQDAEVRRRLASGGYDSDSLQGAAHDAMLFARYVSLVATINGAPPQPDPGGVSSTGKWIAAVLNAVALPG